MSTRCYASPECWTDDVCVLEQEEAHHLLRVLRKHPGDEIDVFDGNGRSAHAVIEKTDGKNLHVKLLEVHHMDPPFPSIHLYMALIKNQRMDWLLQKATELGVTSITPLQTGHCVVKKSGPDERGRRILMNAARQCASNWIPALHPVQPLDETFCLKSNLALIGALRADAEPLHSVLNAANPLPSIDVCIGPEGDFTDAEVNILIRKGAVPVSFGSRILRAETAGIYILSVLQYVFSNRA